MTSFILGMSLAFMFVGSVTNKHELSIAGIIFCWTAIIMSIVL